RRAGLCSSMFRRPARFVPASTGARPYRHLRRTLISSPGCSLPTLPSSRISRMSLAPSENARPTFVRFGVLGFICSLSLLTYLDRVCIMRAQNDITRDLGLSETEMGVVFSAFLLGYALFEVPGGWMGDRWGSRRVIGAIVLWWSVFTALSGCIPA